MCYMDEYGSLCEVHDIVVAWFVDLLQILFACIGIQYENVWKGGQ